jgi:hypothetical protein
MGAKFAGKLLWSSASQPRHRLYNALAGDGLKQVWLLIRWSSFAVLIGRCRENIFA